MNNLHPVFAPIVASIPRINLATAQAIRDGANLAWLAIEMQEMPSRGLVSDGIRDHLAQGKPVKPVIQMVHDQYKTGGARELIRVFGAGLLRSILKTEI